LFSDGMTAVNSPDMRKAASLLLIIGLIVCPLAACGSPASPSPPAGYTGEWAGISSQGTPVQFRVSAADEVTSVSIAYNFSPGCTGTLAFSDVALPIHLLDPPAPPPYDQPGFGYATNEGTSGTILSGSFSRDRRSASGRFGLVAHETCGTVISSWTATRR
jgi:hypothetical protein